MEAVVVEGKCGPGGCKQQHLNNATSLSLGLKHRLNSAGLIVRKEVKSYSRISARSPHPQQLAIAGNRFTVASRLAGFSPNLLTYLLTFTRGRRSAVNPPSNFHLHPHPSPRGATVPGTVGMKDNKSRPRSRLIRRSESRGPKESRTYIPHPMDSLV